jgi:hypothetical protein
MNLKIRSSTTEHRNVLVSDSFQILLKSETQFTFNSNGHFMQCKIVTYLMSDFLAQILVFPESSATWSKLSCYSKYERKIRDFRSSLL